MQVLFPCLPHSPGLELVHRVSGGVEIVVLGDLGQIGGVPAILASVLVAPGLEFRVGHSGLNRRRGLGMNAGHGISWAFAASLGPFL
jgi:hypothetical protein